MSVARTGDRVILHYIGTLDNGRIFDQRDAEHPLTVTLGDGEIFPALESEIIGMAVGAVKNVHLPMDKAYGPRHEANLLRVSRDMFPAGRALRIGEQLSVEFSDQERRQMRVRNIDGHQVLLDGNHDLAGCDLTFALELVGID